MAYNYIMNTQKNSTPYKTLATIAAATALTALALRASRRSGVTDDDLAQSLPGDNIIPDAGYVADRATIINATPEDIWPWLIQLGRDRAGWYAPTWLERLLVWNKAKRGARHIVPAFQKLRVGDVVPDWGPGELEVLAKHAPHVLIYGSVKPRDSEGYIPGDYLFSWVHTVEQISPTQSRVYTRLRMRTADSPVLNALAPVAGVFDYATMVTMYAGLKQNVEAATQRVHKD